MLIKKNVTKLLHKVKVILVDLFYRKIIFKKNVIVGIRQKDNDITNDRYN